MRMNKGNEQAVSVSEQLTKWHLLLFTVSLPFDRIYSELILVSLLLHVLIQCRKTDLLYVPWKKMLYPGSLLLLTLAGTLYTRFYDEALYEAERQLAFILFPFIVLLHPFPYEKYRLQLLRYMALGYAMVLVYLYYCSFGIIRLNHLPASALFSNAFLNHNFSAPIEMHATYFSMYIALAATGVVVSLMQPMPVVKKIMWVPVLGILCAGLLQLSSRSVLIAVALIVNCLLPFLVKGRAKQIRFCLLILGISAIVLYGFTRIDDLRNRFVIELKEDLTASMNSKTGEPRALRWSCATELIRQSPLYGHGSGSEVALLKDCYLREKLYHSYLNDLNAHNEYLSMLIKFGVPGLLLLLWLFFAGGRMAFRRRDICFAAFILIAATVCFSENILDANKGIFFFAFFYSIFCLPDVKRI